MIPDFLCRKFLLIIMFTWFKLFIYLFRIQLRKYLFGSDYSSHFFDLSSL